MRILAYCAPFLCLAAGCMTLPPLPDGLPRTVGGPRVAAPEVEEIAQELFDRVNRQRLSVGLPLLQSDPALDLLATRHSAAMASGRVPFGHDGFEERIEAARSGVAISRASENVATSSFPPHQVAVQAVVGWIGSAGHRANLEGPYEMTGVGVARSAGGEYYLTQIYITR